MPIVKLRLITCLLLAFSATSAFAQSKLLTGNEPTGNTTVLPLWNNQNGQVDALLLIEPSALPQLPSQRIIRPAGKAAASDSLQLRAGLSLEANPGMGVLCNSGSVITSVGSMAGHCMLVNLGNQGLSPIPGSKSSVNGSLQLQRSRASVTGSVGVGRETLGGNLNSIGNSAADRRLLDSLLGSSTATLDSRNASLIGQVSLGTQSWVSIGGKLARVRLIPTDQIRGGLPPEWNSGSLSLGGGIGNFGGEITGQMIEVPGQASRYSSLGAGVTWRTPWRAKLSVGADNLVTRGKNPFGLPDARPAAEAEEGRVPYVRYQQDL
ncbi:MAG: hypothetical protein A3E01_09620 [Gammaproteobacteria bacterium RIFCSPHIGHO2_12_FULL_63_22]|nr:MAG: hypothetical protein A3E01_09620 [Gammaproteobacteria bacterium RIFCSPHIGHO2_12_FULL_63_22]